MQEFVWAFGSEAEQEMEKQIARQIAHLTSDKDVEELIHGRWSHMEALDEDEWLEHLEEHLKEIVNISGKDEETLAKGWKNTGRKYMTGLHRNIRNWQNVSGNADICWMNICGNAGRRYTNW